MTGIGYILFFLQQLQGILPDSIEDRRISLILLIAILTPISIWLRSMKRISYLQIIAMTCLIIALGQLWLTAIDNISTPHFEKHFTSVRFSGIPYFFGICCFAFEGNGLTLEIYRSMEHRKKDFTKTLGLGIALATVLFQLTGILLYNAFAQFT